MSRFATHCFMKHSPAFHFARRFGAALLTAAFGLSGAIAVESGDYWLQQYGLPYWALDLDQDGDGFTTRQEYLLGTDPTSSLSRPPQLTAELGAGSIVLSWPSRPGARYVIGRSLTLETWTPDGSLITGNGAILTAEFSLNGGREFFRLEGQTPTDADGDLLSSVEEGLLGTDPALADTDGDGLSDGTEVFVTFTNPLVPDLPGATIRGQVMTDPNGDGNTADGVPVSGAEVYLDSNYDGDFDTGEPRLLTGADGRYEFTHVRPGVYHVRQRLAAGQIQTKPVPAASPVLNGLPDEVANYTHAAGGNLPVPYGARAVPGVVVPYVIFPPVAQEVSPSVVLQPIGRRDEVPAMGIWSFNDHLTLPQGASILLHFDETIIDGSGADFVIYKLTQGSAAAEAATLEVGMTPAAMTPITTIADVGFGNTSARPVDLGALGVTGPIRYLRLTSLNNVGVFAVFEFVGVEAIHFAQPDAQALEVVVVGTETHENQDFARHFRDDPPTVFVFVNGNDFRVGQSASVRVQAEDDIAVISRTLTANGTAVPLNAQGESTVPLNVAGTVTLVATATDGGGHTSTKAATIYVNNADGSSPFNANLTGANAGTTFTLRFVTPASGAIVGTDTPVVASIEGLQTPNWAIDYAPVDLINPYDMAATDPDWTPLGSGSGFVANQTVGTFPAATLPNGIYFLRLTATPAGGGLTAYHGQVVAKGVAPEDIQPRVTITSPTAGSSVPLTVPIVGSITSKRPLVEWFAEYAPAASVDLNDLGSDVPPWKRFAQGTTTIANNVIASFDTSLVADGSYVIRIVAWNDIRLGWAEPLALEVAGTVKLGRLRREFTDLSLPIGGIPFAIRRIYDTLDAGKDAGLGFGWSLAFLNPGISETVPQTGSGLFGATPFREGTRVYINTPDGRRVGFTFHAEFGVAGLIGNIYKAQFIPDPGVYEKLETPEGSDPFLSIDSNGNIFLFLLGFAWNPSTYILTTADGIRYTYDEAGGFLEARDTSGNTLVATTTGLRHSTGTTVDFVRDGNGRITQILTPDGVTVDYGYNAAGDLTTVTDDDGRVTTNGYDAASAHYLKSVTDPLGRVGVTYEYDAAGRLVATIDEDGHRVEQAWNPGGFTGTITDRNGNVTSLVYDARGNVIQETNALGQVTTHSYGDPANPDKETSRTDARGNTTRWTYDARGNVTEVRRPISFNETYLATYSADGDMLTERSFDGQVSEFTYDAQRRLTRRELPGEPATDFAYSSEGFLVEESVNGGGGTVPFSLTTREYDPQGRLARLSNNHGFSAQTTYAANGNLLGATLPGGRTYSFAYDAAGMPTSETDPAGNHTSTVVEPDGLVKFTDRLGRITRRLVATDGKVERITQADGSATVADYDNQRNLISVTDAAGNVSQVQYDALNRAARYTDAAGAFATKSYDAVGNVTEIINRNGRRRTFVYDANNRLTHERWHDGDVAVIRDFAYSYFHGALSQVTDGAATWSIVGAMPRPAFINVTYPGQATRRIQYVWEQNGVALPSPGKITLTGGSDFIIVTATYDGPNLQRLQWSPPDDFFGPEWQFLRGADGLLSEVKRIHGTVKSRTTYSWDLLGRLANYSHLGSNGAPLHANAPTTITRDADSRITGIVRSGDTTGYTYDVLDQLTAVSHTAGGGGAVSYNPTGGRE